METINQRIKALRENLELNQTQFSKILGLKNQSNISMIEKGKGGFNIIIIEKITKKYSNLNIDWLMRGEGTMWKTDNNLHKNASNLTLRENQNGIKGGASEPNNIDMELLSIENTYLKEKLQIKEKQIESLKKPSPPVKVSLSENAQTRMNF